MTPNLTEKRTIIDVQAIKHALSHGSLRWVPTHEQLADGLTKFDQNLVTSLALFLSEGWVQLHNTTPAESNL